MLQSAVFTVVDLMEQYVQAYRMALIAAVTRTTQQARTEAIRQIRQQYNIKRRDIAQYITSKVYPSVPEGWVIAKGKPHFPLEIFDATQSTRKGGTTVRIKKGSKKLVHGAFIPSGIKGSGVYKRVGQSRLPIKKLYTLGPGGMMGSKGVYDAVVMQVGEQFAKNFSYAFDYYVSQISPSVGFLNLTIKF